MRVLAGWHVRACKKGRAVGEAGDGEGLEWRVEREPAQRGGVVGEDDGPGGRDKDLRACQMRY